MDVMHFPVEAREAFSLWLVSDLLGTVTSCVIIIMTTSGVIVI